MNKFGIRYFSELDSLSIAGSGEHFSQFLLLDPNTDESFFRYGREKVKSDTESIVKLVGEHGSIRYLYRDPGTNCFVSGLQLVQKGNVVVVSTIYTDTKHREKGIATMLIRKALKTYRNQLVLSNYFTEQGSLFFRVSQSKLDG
jgi:ribosomal protein S18 acetylase RimI-like enzyme